MADIKLKFRPTLEINMGNSSRKGNKIQRLFVASTLHETCPGGAELSSFIPQYIHIMSGDDTYEIPLQDQRVFGAGIKRKRVKFVPSSSSSSSITPASGSTSAKSVSDLYLSLVLPREAPSPETSAQSILPSPSPTSFADNSIANPPAAPDCKVCEVCNLPLSTDGQIAPSTSYDSLPQPADSQTQHPPPKQRPHEASLAHQVCLTHSHPPSHLDRKRKGLAYLSAYGWDPDARQGLGAEGQGIQFPLKTKPKDDKLGIGVVLPKPGEIKRREKVQKLDAGKVRKLQEWDRRKGEKLAEMFYRSGDVERYLGRG